MKKILLLSFLLPFFVYSQHENTKENKYMNMYNSGKSSDKIIEKLKREEKKNGKEETVTLINELIINAKKLDDDQNVIYFTFAKISLGLHDILILEDTIGSYLRVNYSNEYKELEVRINSEFIKYCSVFYPNIDLELTFIYRYLHRLDQRYKQQFSLYENDHKSLDSLKKLSIAQDSFTETVLGNIFERHGIPGITEVGPEVNVVEVFFLHLNPKFVFKYLPDLQKGIEDKRIFISDEGLEFIVDKSLHKCCKKTIYGTSWSKYSPLVQDSEEVERIKREIGIK